MITPEIVAEHGLSESEYAHLLTSLGRTPNLTELGIFSVMWSEHCSYKSSKRWLKTLPTTAPWVICGPGENAGVIDIGDGQAAVFKMESHNHPSFIEPYQGAATGVGGILRDVFTMGARPVANVNALRFGAWDHARTRHLVSGVVAGIGGYGNCMGIPTVAGETSFHPGYNGNILVNAMTVGVAATDRLFYSAAAGVGNPVVYVGARTGRDGIHGATMASAEFNADSEEKRPTVQVGDPFTEKLLLEACLELMATDAIVAIQDMGAAGLTSSSVEMASKGGVGLTLHLDRVPQREEGMTPYEIMLSESQERMLMVLRPGHEEEAAAIFHKWELEFAVIGELTEGGHLVLTHHGEVVADLPLDPLANEAPEYDLPSTETPLPAPLLPVTANATLAEDLRTLLGTPDLCSRAWIWRQYDHMVGGDTVGRPGGDAGIVRVHGTRKALAVTSDCTPRYCLAHPVTGGRQAVAEAWRNLIAVGAHPLAITDNLNFGNPRRPEIMGQIAGCVQGMGEACAALHFPVVSGNVSLNNETEGRAIPPTPTVGAVGLLHDHHHAVSLALPAAGQALLLVGETTGWLGQSLYLRECLGREDGPPPPVDLAVEKRNGDFVHRLIQSRVATACHDLADGGVLVAVAEMALAGRVGVRLTAEALPADLAPHAWAFGEDQARYLVTVTAEAVDMVREMANEAGVPVTALGTTGGTAIVLPTGAALPLADLRAAHETPLPRHMSAPH